MSVKDTFGTQAVSTKIEASTTLLSMQLMVARPGTAAAAQVQAQADVLKSAYRGAPEQFARVENALNYLEAASAPAARAGLVKKPGQSGAY